MKATNFHLSLPCVSLESTKRFYTENLNCKLGRNSTNWCDINLFGNQLTFIHDERFKFPVSHYNFRGSVLPSFHFGVLLEESAWLNLRSKCREQNIVSVSTISFLQNEVGEHSSFFVEDPNSYLVEFKCFRKSEEIFSTK